MRLLVTNDDGIGSVFLHELVHALRRAGHDLFVVAPLTEQSWTGASKSRNRAVVSEVVDRGFGCPTWTVDGTPSDCVNIGLAHLLPRPAGAELPDLDGVVSGINIGFNASLGFILASGTISGAWEGALHGLPGVACSQDLPLEVFDHLKETHGVADAALLAVLRVSASRAAGLSETLLRRTPRQSFTVHNLNFPYPCTPDSPVERTYPARVIVPRLFSPAADDGTHRFVFSSPIDLSPPDLPTDRRALAAGRISHTVLDYRTLGGDASESHA